jgi:ankyrin repeat protein
LTGRTPLVYAIGCKKRGQVDIVRYLLDHGANPNNVDRTGFTPLHEATKIGNSVAITFINMSSSIPCLQVMNFVKKLYIVGSPLG